MPSRIPPFEPNAPLPAHTSIWQPPAVGDEALQSRFAHSRNSLPIIRSHIIRLSPGKFSQSFATVLNDTDTGC
jgi:hypothetical protein